ncbi:MAG: methyltransferase domain-containing protein [Bacteroidota bacterium]
MNRDIRATWQENAEEWIKVIEADQISSRTFTNVAILKEIRKENPQKAVDIGCGEGWLTREMTRLNIKAIGLDATMALLDHARNQGPESYYEMTFEDLAAGTPIPEAPFDLAVFNFCLYEKDNTARVLQQTLNTLEAQGFLLIQTLHPFTLLTLGENYESQWLSDAWRGLPGNFSNGHAWYARTFQAWSALLQSLKGTVAEWIEVLNDEKRPVSLILKIQRVT